MRASGNILDYGKTYVASLLGGRSLWALGDQLLISFANFTTMILVAKALGSPAAFGTFSIIYSVLLLANILQFALITQPHNVLGATRHDDDYKLYTTATAFVQILLVIALTLLTGLAAIIGAFEHWAIEPQLVALAAAIGAWQLQEFCRRVLYTETRLRGAFANDVISYGGQMLIVAVLWYRHTLTGEGALWALAVTSAIAAFVGFWQIRDAFKWQLSKQAMLDNWHFGKWLLGSELLQWLSSLQMYLYLAALILGTGASGTLRAAQILFGPTRVIGYFLQTVLPTRFARAIAEEGESALAGHLRRACVLIVVGLGPYCLLLALFPKWILTTVFDASYATHPEVLVLYSLQALMSYFAMVVVSALAARRMTRDVFTSCVWGSVVAVALSWPFIKFVGVAGAIACMMASTIIMSIFLVHRYRTRQQPPAQPPKQRGFDVIVDEEQQACPS